MKSESVKRLNGSGTRAVHQESGVCSVEADLIDTN